MLGIRLLLEPPSDLVFAQQVTVEAMKSKRGNLHKRRSESEIHLYSVQYNDESRFELPDVLTILKDACQIGISDIGEFHSNTQN